MKKALKDHLGDFVAILALVLLAVGVGGYILSNQRLRFPLVEDKPFVLKVELDDAQAVQPGQGQTVRTAGVEIGQIGKVVLKDGKALVELQIEQEYKSYVKRDATALLRTKTGLKDMFIEVDPGTGKTMPENGTIPSASTAPDIDPDEILSALDTDTRSYLQLLVSGAGKGLKGRGNDLQETYARLGPTNRDLARVNTSVARRKSNLKNLINKYGLLTSELATKDRQIVRLVKSSNAVFESLATQNNQISSAVNKLPGTLDTTSDTLTKVDRFSPQLSSALQALRSPIRKLDPANKQVLPLVREATPQIRDQIRPFTRIATPYIRDLGSGAKGLSAGAPDLTTSFNKLNRLFNIGAFNPNGAEGLTGNPLRDRDRQEGYLYWLGWTAQNTNSLFSTADAMGPLRRITLGGLSCGILTAQLGGVPPTVKPVIDTLVTTLGSAGVCTN